MTTDTLEYVKRLEAAGVPRPRAEARTDAIAREASASLMRGMMRVVK